MIQLSGKVGEPHKSMGGMYAKAKSFRCGLDSN